MSLSWKLTIPLWDGGPSIEHQKWAHFPQYRDLFGDTFSTVEHMRKGTVPVYWKNLIEYNSELATQENFNLTK